MAPVPNVGRGFFPLDEQLGLDGSDLTPHAQEGLVRLATWVPFGRAAELLQALVGVQVSKATARRFTLQTGKAALAQWHEEAKQLKQGAPPAPQGASKQVLSADGAMVPLVGGDWAEVKTLVIAAVKADEDGEPCREELSYCSRLTDAESFESETLVETHRRGLEHAEEVGAVMDGAEWLQGLIDYHRQDAVRILDFAHAAEYLSAIADLARQAGSALASTWLAEHLHELKHEGPTAVLSEVRRLQSHHPEVEDLLTKGKYLEKREGLMQYPLYQAQGWPIGSGMVESANKVVVEARLKGAGMHWERENVNVMLVLRNAVCNDRWDETWQVSTKQRLQTRQQQRDERTQAQCEQAVARLLKLLLWWRSPTPRPRIDPTPRPLSHQTSASTEVTPRPRRPAANHPWRRAIVAQPKEAVYAKQ